MRGHAASSFLTFEFPSTRIAVLKDLTKVNILQWIIHGVRFPSCRFLLLRI